MFQAMNKYGNNLYIADIEITSPTGVNDGFVSKDGFSIHPNPNNGYFTVSTLQDEVYDIEIYNAQGQLIKSEKSKGTTIIQLDRNKPGIYFVRIKTSEFNKIEKVIVR